ncbi:MAG: hypothetical protein WA667_04315 [Candidatus Nitrosopolaris sp.]
MVILIVPIPYAVLMQNGFDASAEENADEIKKFLDYIKTQGEDHYTTITAQMDNIIKEILNVKTITAKETTKVVLSSSV